jgi:hypothetical protein
MIHYLIFVLVDGSWKPCFMGREPFITRNKKAAEDYLAYMQQENSHVTYKIGEVTL